MKRRAKRVREGQDGKEKGRKAFWLKLAYFSAHVEKTRFRRTGLSIFRLVKSGKATGRSSYTTARHST
jgi:hypothetical protein